MFCTDIKGRIGRRQFLAPNGVPVTNGNYRVIQYLTDISINYLDLSWNFYVALDTSRNFFQGYPITLQDGSIRDPIINIYDISYNGRSDVDVSGNQYVPKLYDSSGGSGFAFSGLNLQLDYWNNNNYGFTYSPQLYDPAEVLPVSGGGGTDASGGSGGGGEDPSGEIIEDVSDNSANIAIIDNSLNNWFFDPPKVITSTSINLNTQGQTPFLDISWNNPTQKRAAFDFIGNYAPHPDISGTDISGSASNISGIGLQNRDDYNFLPYFQGLKIEYCLFEPSGSPFNFTGWYPVPQTTGVLGGSGGTNSGKPMKGVPTDADVNFWNDTSNNSHRMFLPKTLTNIKAYSPTDAQNPGGGLVPGIVLDLNNNTYSFRVARHWPPGTNTAASGKNVGFRIAMINRARATINDPSYVEHYANFPSSPDVSWNWVYIPETGGMGIAEYEEPTPPLTLIVPSGASLKYNQFTLSGRNDNSGNDIVAISTEAVVEMGLKVLFTSLNATSGLPKVRYRYDISGHRLSSSKQVGGNEALIDISKNLPDTDISANWYPSTTNPSSDPNSWSDICGGTGTVVYPQHKYEYKGYSMRYDLDPSANRDASLNSVFQDLSWNTPYPTRTESTQIASNGGYRDSLNNTTINTPWLTDGTDATWTQNDYFVNNGAIKAFQAPISTKTELLFLNNGNEVGVAATTIDVTYLNSHLIRANDTQISGSEWFVGLDTSGEEIIRIRSRISIDNSPSYPSHTTDTDLSGVQKGFIADPSSVATYPSNNYLEWRTSALINAYDNGDISRNGGYYCGTDLSNIKIKNVNLINYQDVSNNTGTPGSFGYKFAIWQELNDGSGNWVAYPVIGSSSSGITKSVNIAQRPVEDISFQVGFSSFKLKDGYNGTASYTNADNKFKFGSTGVGQNPTANFFGLPMLATTSQDIIDYSLVVNKIDATWFPTDGNLMGDLKLYFKPSGATPAINTYTNWGGQTVDKPWSGASAGGYPFLPRQVNGADTLSGNFDFDNTGTGSFTANKYSRSLMPTTYTPSTTFPLFYVNANYDNNILRLNRGGTGLEAGTLRDIDTDFGLVTNYINRLLGKGCGSNGSFTLFWDNTFDNTKTFQNVGEIGSSPYNEYPFVEFGQSPDVASIFSHTSIMTGTIANKQLMWAKNGFKHGQWNTSDENPYIDYTTKYWFGNHTSPLVVNYSSNNTTGETLGSIASTYNSADITPWYDNSNPSSFTLYTGPYKVIVVKDTKTN